MISDNIMKLCFSDFTFHTYEVIEAFVVFSSSWCLHRRKCIVDLHSYQTRIDHCIFGRSRMYVESFDYEISFACVKVFILDFTFCVSVQCVTVVCIKTFYIEMRSAGSNLFIRSKCNTDRSVRNILFIQMFDHCKNLGDSGFIVGTENGCTVCCNQCTSFQACKMWKVLHT